MTFVTDPFAQNHWPNNACHPVKTLNQHILMANFQSLLNRHVLAQYMVIPDLRNHEWVVKNDKVSVKWFDCELVPEGLLTHESCKYAKSKCISNQCKCHKNGVRCTNLCACTSCENYEKSQVEIELLNDCSDDEVSDLEDDWFAKIPSLYEYLLTTSSHNLHYVSLK